MKEREKKRAGIYVRVSTTEQKTDAQEKELRDYAERRGWQVQKVYSDKESGAKFNRPALDELMVDCRRRKIDVVLVWKFDRFARSLRQLIVALDEFKRLGIDFVSSTESVDTSIPSGELLFQIFGAIGQFERSLISERTKAGLEHARREGKRLGRPPLKKLSLAEIRQLRRDRRKGGASFKALANRYGTSVWTAFELCKSKA